MSERTIRLLVIAVVTIGAVTGVVAAEGTLGVTVEDADGEPTVTVTENDTAVENASVNVTTVTEENASDDTNATNDTNATYVGEGNYTTDENGTVDLPAVEENVTVEVTATAGNETDSTVVDLTADDGADEDRPFGQLVREFIGNLGDRDDGIGGSVSDFVTENNPGNAPDHAGNPGGPNDDAANASDANGDDANESDGPGNAPDHAGNGDDEAADDDEADDDADDDEAADDGDDADESDEDDADETDDAETDEDGPGNAPGNGGGSGNAPGLS